jgi:hypothetical protein
MQFDYVQWMAFIANGISIASTIHFCWMSPSPTQMPCICFPSHRYRLSDDVEHRARLISRNERSKGQPLWFPVDDQLTGSMILIEHSPFAIAELETLKTIIPPTG